MVELRKIEPGGLGAMIHEAFKDDWALIRTYHLVNGNLANCVRSTFKEIDKVAQQVECTDYGVYWLGKPIGFTVLSYKMLVSFGINIQYRRKEIILHWWNLVNQHLGPEFVTWLYKKNDRAIDFLKRNGMEVQEDHDVYVSLVYCDMESLNEKT
jgi:hypothetical protein